MKTFHKLFISLLLILLACTDEEKVPATTTQPEVIVDLSDFRAGYEQNLRILADDSMAGRWLQENGIEKTVKFLKTKFKAAGLQSFAQFPDLTHAFSAPTPIPEISSLKINGVALDPGKYLIIPKTTVTAINKIEDVKVTYFNDTEGLSKQVQKHFDSALKNENHLVIIPEKFQTDLETFKEAVNDLKVLTPNVNWGLSSGYTLQYGKNNIIYAIGANQAIQTFEVEHTLKQLELQNVVGYLEGKSKPEEYIVFSAHMDHLGIRGTGNDQIFNGANDNASGVAAVITLAEYFSKANLNERSLIFIEFTAEEMGGIGSREFVSIFNKLKKVQAVINIDMIGNISSTGEGTAFLSGHDRSTMLEVMNNSMGGLNRKIYNEPVDINYFFRSDNVSFFNAGIVAHSITTYRNGDPLYHSPDDEVASINFNSAFQIVETIAQGSLSMARGTATPSFK
jgi:hypothetical protein